MFAKKSLNSDSFEAQFIVLPQTMGRQESWSKHRPHDRPKERCGARSPLRAATRKAVKNVKHNGIKEKLIELDGQIFYCMRCVFF